MPPHLIPAVILITLTVAIHAVGAVMFLRMLTAYSKFWERHANFVVNILSLSWVVGILVSLHIAEVGLWAGFYYLHGLLPDFNTSIYYSLSAYTTVGFGDVVLPRDGRLLGATEALVGILMTSWSVALLIGVLTEAYRVDQSRSGNKPPDSQS